MTNLTQKLVIGIAALVAGAFYMENLDATVIATALPPAFSTAVVNGLAVLRFEARTTTTLSESPKVSTLASSTTDTAGLTCL